jgi:RNA polymerase sigma-70 factor, ECF subfamily
LNSPLHPRLEAAEAAPQPEERLGSLSLAGGTLEAEMLELYEKHAAALARMATAFCGNSEVARDAVQDSLVRYFELRRSGAPVHHAKAWLMRVLKNHLIDLRRKGRLQQEMSTSAMNELMDTEAGSPDEDAEIERLWKRLAALVTPKELECLRMRAAGFTYAEIAEALQVQSGTVSVFLSRSREKAAELLMPPRGK